MYGLSEESLTIVGVILIVVGVAMIGWGFEWNQDITNDKRVGTVVRDIGVKFNEEREAWFTNPTKTFSYLDCDGVVKERTLALNISLRYTLYDGGYNFATLLYAVYSDVNGWTIQMEKE